MKEHWEDNCKILEIVKPQGIGDPKVKHQSDGIYTFNWKSQMIIKLGSSGVNKATCAISQVIAPHRWMLLAVIKMIVSYIHISWVVYRGSR